jgi:putative ABC transport system permease protein
VNPLRYAFRSLARTPGYTLIALTTLALGIGVNTSMFSIVDGLLFRAAPYPEPARLVQLTRHSHAAGRDLTRFSEQELREVLPAAEGFSSLTAYDRMMYTSSSPGQPAERLLAIRFTGGVMETLAVQPLIGRGFSAEEFEPGQDQVVMLMESVWRARFGADPNILGRTLRLDGDIVTIVGVVPLRYEYRAYWGNVAFWRPLNYSPDQLNQRGYRQFWVIGRLKTGVIPSSVGVQLAPLATQQETAFPQDYPGVRYDVISLNDASVDDVRRSLSWMLLALATFVLLIACANLANLQLARSTSAMREFAIRAALGASRARLIGQQLTECILLALAGGGLGFLVALWLNRLAEHAILVNGAQGFEATMNGGIMLGALALSLGTGVAFGLLPALLSSRADVTAALKSQARGSTVGPGQRRMRQTLIVSQVALALVLLSGAAIINRGFSRMLERHVGWETSGVLTAILPIPETRYATPVQRIEFFAKLEERLAAIPGVAHAALATSLPLFNGPTNRPVFLDSPATGNGSADPVAWHYMVTSDYFSAMGMRLLEGRAFARELRADSPQQIIVGESLARHFWPGESAVGKRLGGFDEGRPVWREVIGVVGDVEPAASADHAATRLAVYRPLVQEPWSYVNIVLRGTPELGRVDSLAQPLRRAVSEVDPELAADFIVTVRQFVDVVQNNVILVGKMLLGFAGLGLLLAAIGLYGVISRSVAERTSEFGIRLALGAQPRDLLRQVLSRGLWLTAIGLIIGLFGVFALGRVLSAIIPRIAGVDPLGIGGVVLLLFAVTLLACWLPARRATKVNPLTALRAE